MTLFKRGNVYWAYVYRDGVRHAKSTGTGNRRQAETIEQHFKDDLNLRHQGLSQFAPEMTFAELAAKFLSAGGATAYHIDRLKVLLPYWGEMPIGRITKTQAREYRLARHAQKRLKDATVNRDLSVLRHLLFWAVDEGLISANPLSRMRLVPERRTPRIMIPVADEEKLLTAAAPHLRLIALAALDAGLRRGEILGQLNEHVDYTRRILYVTVSKTPGGEGREIPLTDRLFAALEPLRDRSGLLFTFNGQPLRRIKTAWKSAIRRAGIRYVRFHDLRHAFNTRLMEAGVMQEVRKVLMGHSSGSEVNAIYTHVELPLKREAIRKLELWQAGQIAQLATQPQDAAQEIENHSKDDLAAFTDDQHRHKTTDAQTRRTCRNDVKRSSGLVPIPKFKRRK
jgi:integrase